VLVGTTRWRFAVEEIERAGHRARLADPAETAARMGVDFTPRRRARAVDTVGERTQFPSGRAYALLELNGEITVRLDG
jgi:hypothetical protein